MNRVVPVFILMFLTGLTLQGCSVVPELLSSSSLSSPDSKGIEIYCSPDWDSSPYSPRTSQTIENHKIFCRAKNGIYERDIALIRKVIKQSVIEESPPSGFSIKFKIRGLYKLDVSFDRDGHVLFGDEVRRISPQQLNEIKKLVEDFKKRSEHWSSYIEYLQKTSGL